MPREIEFRMPSESGGVQSTPSGVTQKKAAVCASRTWPSGRDEERLVETALLGDPLGQHVAGVREALGALEHQARAVGHEGQPRVLPFEEAFQDQHAVAASREHDAHVAADRPGGREQRLEVPFDLRSRAR